MKAVIFDFDGTIANTLPLCIEAFRRSIEPLAGRSVSDKEIIETFGPSEEGTITALIPEFYEQGLQGYLEYYGKLHKMCKEPFDGIKEVIDYLRDNNVIVALVTGKGKKSCDLSLAYYNMEHSFHSIKTGSPKGPCKAEKILEVIEDLKLDPKNVVYVGDTISDIYSAREAGIPIISAMWGNTLSISDVEKHNPNKILSSVAELKHYLGEWISI